MVAKPPVALARNVRLYPWYAGLFNAHFWLPVFFLYFSEHCSLEQVLRLEAIYYVAVVVLEVPSGWFSDTVGRRPTLLAATTALVAAYALFVLGDGFAVFAVAQVCLAAGMAFNSGTDTSFHYDSLAALGRAEEFAAREARVAHVAFTVGAVAAVGGGAVAALGLRWAYGGSLVAAVAGVIVVLGCTEPSGTGPEARRGLVGQLRAVSGYAGNAGLRWLFGFSVLMTVLNHVPYEFFQPYLELLTRRAGGDASVTPLAAGAVTGGTMLVAAWFARRSVALRDRMGTGGVLLAATALQIVVIAGMGLVLHAAVIVLILARSVPRALMTAPLNAAIAPRVATAHRATYLSVQSLVGRLSFSAVLLGLSSLAGADGGIAPSPIARMLLLAAGLGAAGLLVLGATVRAVGRSFPDRGQGS